MQILNSTLNWTILIILLAILGLAVLNILIGIIFYSIFYHKLKKGRRSITIIIQAKYDLIQKIIELLPSDLNISSTLDLFNSIDQSVFRKVEKEEFKIAKDNLSIVKNELFKIIKENDELNNNEVLSLLISNINENDDCYRSRIVTYNTNVQGFNYWIRFIPSRFIFSLAKIKAKSPLS